MKVEVDVLGSMCLIVIMASVDVKRHCTNYELSQFRSCVKVEVDVLGV